MKYSQMLEPMYSLQTSESEWPCFVTVTLLQTFLCQLKWEREGRKIKHSGRKRKGETEEKLWVLLPEHKGECGLMRNPQVFTETNAILEMGMLN
jgi:hypothetical protein